MKKKKLDPKFIPCRRCKSLYISKYTDIRDSKPMLIELRGCWCGKTDKETVIGHAEPIND